MAGFAKKATTEAVHPQDVSTIFTPATQLENIKAMKIGLFGKAKVGKTHFCLGAKAPVYIIDTEDSVRINVKQLTPKQQENIHVASVIKFADKATRKIDLVKSLDALVDAIDTITDVIQQSESDPGAPRGTLIIDSATDIWDWLSIWLDEAAEVKRTKDGSMPRFEWGKANKKYTEIMYMLLRSNWNVVLTFRAKEAMSAKGESLGYELPRWQKNTDYWLDLIVELRKAGVRELVFRGGRYGDNIPTLEDPSWEKLLKHLEKHTGVTFE